MLFDQIILYAFYISSSLFYIIAAIIILFAGFYAIKILKNIAKSASSLKEAGQTLKEKISDIPQVLITLVSLGEKIVEIIQEKKKKKEEKKEED